MSLVLLEALEDALSIEGLLLFCSLVVFFDILIPDERR